MSVHDPQISDPSTRSSTTAPSLDAPGSAFADWLASKHRHSQYDHAWSQLTDRRLYAKALDVDREWSERHDSFTTVLLTLTIRPPAPGDSVADHADRFWSTPLRRKQRRLLKSKGVWNEHASLSVLAPKLHPDSADVDDESRAEVWSHFHQALWLPGTDWSQADFQGLVELFCSRTPGARLASNAFDQAISIRHHDSADGQGTSSEDGQDSDCGFRVGIPASGDATPDRQPTTALPVEIGNNLPLLDITGGTRDPRSAPTYVQRWAEALWRSSDERGVRRFRTGGCFSRLAEARYRAREADLFTGEPAPRATTGTDCADGQGQDQANCGSSVGIPRSEDAPSTSAPSAEQTVGASTDSDDGQGHASDDGQGNCGSSVGIPGSEDAPDRLLLPAVRESLQFVTEAREAGVTADSLTDALAENDGNWIHSPVPTVIEACF